MSQAVTVKQRECPNCLASMEKGKNPCIQCGWYLGLIPIAQTVNPFDGQTYTTFAAERRSKFRAIVTLLSVLVGIGMIIGGIAKVGEAPEAILFLVPGIPALVAGIATWKITGFGKYWKGLTPGDKAAALPGLIIGTILSLFFIIALPLAWIVLKIFDPRDM